LLGVLFAMLSCAESGLAGLITYEFSGTIDESNPIVNAGDSYGGSFTFESTVTPSAHPDPTLEIQALFIYTTLPGTGWTLDVNSTAVPSFSLSGETGQISVGNDTPSFGDRYVVTLSGADVPLPLGGALTFFQIDLQDPTANGEDMLEDDLYTSLPNLSLASIADGRFFTSDYGSGCTQCRHTPTSLDLLVPIEMKSMGEVTAMFGFADGH
jgi:hypothetical protein